MSTATAPTTPAASFVMPRITMMTPVLVSPKPDFSDPMPAWVTKVGPSTINCLAITENNGFFPFLSCWHKDDPKVQIHKEQIGEDDNRGVWDLTQGEKNIRELNEYYKKINARFAEIERIITDLAAKVTKAR